MQCRQMIHMLCDDFQTDMRFGTDWRRSRVTAERQQKLLRVLRTLLRLPLGSWPHAKASRKNSFSASIAVSKPPCEDF